jgi:hypothetical protein
MLQIKKKEDGIPIGTSFPKLNLFKATVKYKLYYKNYKINAMKALIKVKIQ